MVILGILEQTFKHFAYKKKRKLNFRLIILNTLISNIETYFSKIPQKIPLRFFGMFEMNLSSLFF